MSNDSSVTEFRHVVNAAQQLIPTTGTTSVLIWDWLSCLPQEWRTIWKSKASWSPIKILYCVVRYYTLVVLVGFFASWSESSCARYVRVLPGIAVLIDLSIELIYALYGCDRKIGMFLVALIAGFLGVMIAVPILAFDYTRLPSWPGPCIVTGKPSIAGPKFIIAFYAAPMTLDMVMTAMTVYKVIQQNRNGGSSSLMNRIVRDGLLYFFAITSLNMINVIFFIQGDTLIEAINAPMSIQISSVLCCRLILNLRDQTSPRMSVKKFSNTRGRWVTDIINENSVADAQDTIRFSTRSRERTLHGSTEFESTTTDGTYFIWEWRPYTFADRGRFSGIVVHFEQDGHSDNHGWKTEDNSSIVALSIV
ncbi:hypothetical protein B0H17DRAFT_1162112 [Mycena rosella]|uniref:DUF6533 domain-containing protein n=1 Tax=Mycena rosella TaxID=1033263 RepID=A0AAD7CZF8_MYCRO|nr:hypothetical protein B0H17DRAFT_1162112 [Mycena rosella]